ncbi:MAG: hypothetical protein H6744_19355 [Deltaproteobacteria bacterium]|nr:hypothetical protein [Deltaproteobacteria bacterium]MCB9788838.1 hypothetical protein [Deltaproteobacteria bacterium]
MSPRLLETLAVASFFALLALYTARVIWDIDLFWHIAAGRDFVREGRIAHTDIFGALDPDRVWVSFQWGYEVLVHLLDQAGGLQLVRAVHTAVMLTAFALFYWGLRGRLRVGPIASFVLLALLVVLFEDRIRNRPHVFNLLGWAVMFPWLLRGPAALDRRSMLGAALTLGVWANLHAGGALLFLVAAATLPAGAVLARLLRSEDPAARAWPRAVIWWLCALLPALFSPGFVRGNIQAAVMLEGTEQAIGEWWPAWHFLAIATTAGHVVCGLAPSVVGALWLAVLARGVAARDRLRSVPAWVLLLGLALVVLSHRSVRFVYIAAFGAALLAPWLPRPLAPATWPPRLARGVGVLLAACLVVTSYRFNVTALHGDLPSALASALGPPLDARRFPLAQAAFLEQTGFHGTIFCQPNWGGYLLWRLHPGARVLADGRGNYPRALSDDLAALYDRDRLNAPSDGPAVEALYARYPTDILVHQHPAFPPGYTPDPSRWELLYSDARGTIWARLDSEGGRAFAAHVRELRSRAPAPADAPPR